MSLVALPERDLASARRPLPATPSLAPAPAAPDLSPDGQVLPEAPARSAEAPAADPVSELSALCQALDARIRKGATAHAAALRRLAILRRVNEAGQNDFAGLERHLAHPREAAALVFCSRAEREDRRVFVSAGSEGVAQLLPAASSGLGTVELRLHAVDARPGARLHLDLVALNDHSILSRWSLPLDRLAPGWVAFSLDREPSGAPRLLELRLAVEGPEGAGVTLGGGEDMPVRRFRLRAGGAEDKAILPAAAELRLWTGSPLLTGGALPLPAAPGPVFAGGGIGLPLSPTLLVQAEHVNREDAPFDFTAVRPLPGERAVECHPLADGMTLASLPLPPGRLILEARAELRVANPRSREVEFAAALARDPERAKLLLSGKTEPEPGEGVSAWIAAGPRAPGALSVLARPEARSGARPEARASRGEPGRLFLATRMARPGQADFAWARFADIALRIGT